MSPEGLLPIYRRLNWDAPRGRIRCVGCKEVARAPLAGAYPSALVHYEGILGPLPVPRTEARVLLLLQDPRAGERHFRVASPAKACERLGPTEHRYFCLTPVAWRALKLDASTGSKSPRWPTPNTAHLYLRRYLSARGCWSYDGFLAYFLYLFLPADAVVTDLAKCHFGDDQQRAVYERCATLHLSHEVSLLKPNLVISFTSWLNDARFVREHVPALCNIPRLMLFHPAARHDRFARRARFLEQIRATRAHLRYLGIDTKALSAQWRKDFDRANRM